MKSSTAQRVENARKGLYEGRLSAEQYAAVVRKVANSSSHADTPQFTQGQVLTATVALAAVVVALAAILASL